MGDIKAAFRGGVDKSPTNMVGAGSALEGTVLDSYVT